MFDKKEIQLLEMIHGEPDCIDEKNTGIWIFDNVYVSITNVGEFLSDTSLTLMVLNYISQFCTATPDGAGFIIEISCDAFAKQLNIHPMFAAKIIVHAEKVLMSTLMEWGTYTKAGKRIWRTRASIGSSGSRYLADSYTVQIKVDNLFYKRLPILQTLRQKMNIKRR